MRAICLKIGLIIGFLVCFLGGCEPGQESINGHRVGEEEKLCPVHKMYCAVKVKIMPLTEFVGSGNSENGSQIRVYVSLLDSFGCQIKEPGVFRFELYERVVRSAEPKGKRLFMWEDIDLTDSGENNTYWQDFLRAYEFDLDYEPGNKHGCILQVTYIDVSGRRLSAEFTLKHSKEKI